MKILLVVDSGARTKKMPAHLSTRCSACLCRYHPALGRRWARRWPTVTTAEETEKVTAPVVKFLQRRDLETKVVHKAGLAGKPIAKAAGAGGFDMVVMSKHGHSALGNLVMGSVATQVLAHCKMPVLFVR